MDEDEKKLPQTSMTSLKTRALERNIALTKLGFGAGTQIVAHSLLNIFRGEIGKSEADRAFYQQQARVLADELGKLKGSVMKAGQMLSLYGQYFLPEEAVLVLSELQDSTQPVAWPVVAPVLEKSLGRRRLSQLEIEQEPIAAASLGQVHRARRRSDGLDLAIKIQYPGVANAIDSDIRTLSRLLMMTRLIPRGFDVRPVFAEVKEMLYREIDYASEKELTQMFGERLRGDDRFVVPSVLDDFSSGMVLTTTFERGVSVRHPSVAALPQPRRDRLGFAFIDLFLNEFFRWKLVQSDPHFGNYRFRLSDDGRDQVVLLDFGATRRYEAAFACAYGKIVRGALEREREMILDGAVSIGIMQRDFPRPVIDAFCRMCELIVEPFTEGQEKDTPEGLFTEAQAYRWGLSDLPMRAANVAARNSLTRHFRVPPREIVFLHRRLAGVFIMVARLAAVINARPNLLAALADVDRS